MANPNISLHRPAKSALGHGRVQKQSRVAMWFRNGLITTAEAVEWTHGRRLLCEGRKPDSGTYQTVRLALAAIADPVGRAGGRGRPTIWKAKPDL